MNKCFHVACSKLDGNTISIQSVALSKSQTLLITKMSSSVSLQLYYVVLRSTFHYKFTNVLIKTFVASVIELIKCLALFAL